MLKGEHSTERKAAGMPLQLQRLRLSAQPVSMGAPYGLVNPLRLGGMTGSLQERHPRALPARPRPPTPEPTD